MQSAAVIRQRRNIRRVRVQQAMEKSSNAPIGGWNTRDSLDDMPKKDAIKLENWFPGLGSVKMRNGISSHATGIGSSNVEWLGEYHSGSDRDLLAAGGGGIYDASAAGAATSLKTGFSSNRWNHTNFNGSMGLVNGADTPQTYDGTTVADMTVSGSGLTVTNLVGVHGYKSRTYFWEIDSQDFWYSAVNTLGASLTKFPLSRVGQFGGKLLAVNTLSMDAGNGPDDYIAFIMSSGEVIVYTGSNPGDSSNWSLAGVYALPEPLAQRATVKIGGDLLIATQEDYVSLREVMRRGDGQYKPSKLSGAARDAATSYGGNFGWQAILYPRGNMLLFNVPVTTNGEYEQHVFNTLTKAGCKFTGIDARCFEVYNNDLYVGGGGGVVYKYTGTDDAGANIVAEARQAWDDVGVSGLKQFTGVRPVLSTPGDLTFGINLSYDFGEEVIAQINVTAASGSPWDTSAWDTSSWSPENQPILPWRSAAGVGRKVSFGLKISLQGAGVTWDRTDYLFNRGSGL